MILLIDSRGRCTTIHTTKRVTRLVPFNRIVTEHHSTIEKEWRVEKRASEGKSFHSVLVSVSVSVSATTTTTTAKATVATVVTATTEAV